MYLYIGGFILVYIMHVYVGKSNIVMIFPVCSFCLWGRLSLKISAFCCRERNYIGSLNSQATIYGYGNIYLVLILYSLIGIINLIIGIMTSLSLLLLFHNMPAWETEKNNTQVCGFDTLSLLIFYVFFKMLIKLHAHSHMV